MATCLMCAFISILPEKSQVGITPEIEFYKSRGNGMMIFGSGSIVSQLTQHELVDEYQLVVCPIVLSSGRLLLSDVSKDAKLKLVEAKPYRSGYVLLRVRVDEIACVEI